MPIKYLIFASGIVWALNSSPVLADRRSYVLWGVGNDSCERFVREQSQRSPRFDAELSWIAGFVSAGNGELSAMMAKNNAGFDLLKGADPVAFEKWLVKYCNENSEKNLSSAANALTQSLLRKAPVNHVVPKTKAKQKHRKAPHRSGDLVTNPAR